MCKILRTFAQIFDTLRRYMKKISVTIALSLSVVLSLYSERVETLPYADFNQWVVRYIKQSGILGGKTVVLYAVGPTDTIRKNGPFIYGQNGNIWSSSNTYAKVFGVETGSGTVRPEYRDKDNQYCCRLDTKHEVIKVLGTMHVLATGSLYTGRMIEPVKSRDDPYQNIDFGVKFTKRPDYLMFDYKAKISPEKKILDMKGSGEPKVKAGHDEAQAIIVLQRRWEDADGHIYAERVATGYERFAKDQVEWVNGHRVKLYYGDMSAEPLYKKYETALCLVKDGRRAMNSKGKIVPIQEVGWAKEGTIPTHILINFSSGCYEAYVGYDGNSLWVDNVRLVYKE